MSAATAIAFYGIRLTIREDELSALEDRSHPALLNARKAGLQHYWGKFGGDPDSYYLFIGKLLGKIGVEDAIELRIDIHELVQSDPEVSRKLSDAGFSEAPTLLFQFQPD